MKTAKKKSEEISSASIGGEDDVLLKKDNGELAELRRLIVQPEEVSEVLPSAITHGSQKDAELSKATLPLVEENIRQSVIRNPDVLAEALFPAIGPAIRKAIAEALSQMVQSLNQSLEHSISPRGLRWRMEAWQTGKSFAEVVMLNSLIYRVEEVFLIHRETGGLLQHVSAQKNVSEDADMVSAMLTAIQDFAHDSFKETENAQLDSLQLNDFSVWIERSPDAILAGVIRGNAPLSLRETFKEAIEAIQFVQEEEFEEYEGDTTEFEKSRPMLDNCLQVQLNQEEKKSKFLSPFNILAGVLGLLTLVFGFIYIRDYWRWSNYLNRLQTEKGIVVVESDLGWWKDSISGLRDPAAVNPEEILSEYGLQWKNVESVWKPYQDLSPEMILARANKILQPPAGVELKFENEVLTANGNITPEWISEAKKLSAAIAGVNEFRFASDALMEKINSNNILFNCGTTDFAEGQSAKLDAVKKDLEMLMDSGEKWLLEVRGQADLTGTPEKNAELSRQRADKVVAELNKSAKLNSIKGLLVPIAVGADKNSGCLVDFKIVDNKK
jgi:outer membrane protein OmpA-like peptidoglycan-associated protein